MNLVLNINEINRNNIFFNDSVKNTVITDSNFIRIFYSNKEIIMNGLYIKFNINKNKLKNINNKEEEEDDNRRVIKYLEELELYIINKYKSTNKEVYIVNYKIKEQILYLLNKISNCNNDRVIFSYILKISGLWERDNELGLTYKFIYM